MKEKDGREKKPDLRLRAGHVLSAAAACWSLGTNTPHSGKKGWRRGGGLLPDMYSVRSDNSNNNNFLWWVLKASVLGTWLGC